MVDLRRTPSIQHTVALIAPTVEDTVRNFEALEAAKVTISLEPGRRLFKPLMEGHTEKWALGQIACERKPANITANANLIKAFAPYAADKKVPWFRAFPKDYYPIGSGVVVPLNPAGFWAEDERLRLLWVQAWKTRTLDPLQRAIFHTMMSQRVFVGDFKDADLEWVDLREQRPGKGRDVEVLSRKDFGLLSSAELQIYLQILLDAFLVYRERKAKRREAEKKGKKPGELPLFSDQADSSNEPD